MEPIIRTYVLEAMELEKGGASVDLAKDDIVYPEELIAAMEADPPLQEAFETLTPGRRRGYALFFGQPKQAATREGRIQKMRDRILAGRVCTTGKGQRPALLCPMVSEPRARLICVYRPRTEGASPPAKRPGTLQYGFMSCLTVYLKRQSYAADNTEKDRCRRAHGRSRDGVTAQ